MSRLNAPSLSTCSTPSSHRRPLLSLHPPQPASLLRRSRTLHYRAPNPEYRRRASHPASPSYYTLHQCHANATILEPVHDASIHNNMAHLGCCDANANYKQYWEERSRSIPENLVMEREQQMVKQKELEQEHKRLQQMEMEQKRLNHIELEKKLEFEHKRLKQLELEREKEHKRQKDVELEQKQLKEEREAKVRESLELNRRRFCEHNSSFSQSCEANDTWPKQASRNLQNPAGSRGMYSTLDGPPGCAAATAWDVKNVQMNMSPNAGFNPSGRPSMANRISRSQLLRDRASQLADERSGMSTDEETNTDVLMGRYWSRTERKEHFLLARELRQQQQARGERSTSRERERAGSSTGEVDLRANTVLELSQRKLSRLRNRKLLDDWTTVEELLTHGSRLGDNEDALTCPSSLLTVTTV